MTRSMSTAVLVAALVAPAALAQALWKPAEFRAGMLPVTPVGAVAGGEVFVQVSVSRTGRVSDLVPLRTTPPFTQPVVDALGPWLFQPAEQTGLRIAGTERSTVTEAVESKVLVACVFRPPTLNTPTVGAPPESVGVAADDVVLPLRTVTPSYPPLALVDGTVMLQVNVGDDGSVQNLTTLRSVAGLDQAAREAARQWTFRPARIQGRFVESVAYLIFAFRQPVTSPLGSPGSSLLPGAIPGR